MVLPDRFNQQCPMCGNSKKHHRSCYIGELQDEINKLKAAISWALGEGDSDFGDNKPENAKTFFGNGQDDNGLS